MFTRRDARNVTTHFGFDKLGRTTSESASVDVGANGTPDAVVDTWLFDPPVLWASAGAPPARSTRCSRSASTYTYDTLARPTRRSRQQSQGGGVTQAFVTGSGTVIFE